MGIVDEYVSRTKTSKRIWAEIGEVLPQGITRTVAFLEPHPIVGERGKGLRVWDADGNEYLYFLNNYSALIHGHEHTENTKEAMEAIPEETVFPWSAL